MVVETGFERPSPARRPAGGAPAPRTTDGPGLTQRLSAAPVTFALLAVNGLIFALEQHWGGRDEMATMLRMGAIVAPEYGGFTWARCFAYAYLHFGPIHLLMNMLALANLGAALEPVLGSTRFFVLYTLSAVAGGLMVSELSPHAVTVGASGAIFGLLGAMSVVFWKLRARAQSATQRKELGNVVFRLLVPNLVISLLPGVSFFGHLGGLLVGVGYLGLGVFHLPRFRTKEQEASERSRDGLYLGTAISLALLTLAAIGIVWFAFTPWAVEDAR